MSEKRKKKLKMGCKKVTKSIMYWLKPKRG